jgi:hypothetical protein
MWCELKTSLLAFVNETANYGYLQAQIFIKTSSAFEKTTEIDESEIAWGSKDVELLINDIFESESINRLVEEVSGLHLKVLNLSFSSRESMLNE